LFVLWKLGRFALLSSAKHKEFQIHGGWVQKLVVSDTHPLIAQPRPPTRRPGSEECGYIWNANDAAPASKTVDVKSISLAIDAVGAQQDSLDACSTVKMGRLLRQEGVPYVVFHQTLSRLCSRFPHVNAPSSVCFYNQHIDQYHNHL
jgi:hypothetical protein